MLNNKNIDRNDGMGQQLSQIKKQVTPPPALEKAVAAGVPYGKRVRTATHVLRFARAATAYVVGVALLLGMVFLLPGFWEEGEPVGQTPAATTPSLSTESAPGITYPDPPDGNIPNVAPRDYESVGTPDPGTMSAEMEAEIKAAKAAMHHDVTPEDVTVKFIANLNEKYAVKLEVSVFMYLAVETVETVYGLNFVSGSSNTMKIYAYGRFYSIPDAYTKGVLSAREVQELYVISHHYGILPEIREKCSQRFGGSPDDYFVRFMDSGSRDGGKTMWCLVYLYGKSIKVQSEPAFETVNGMKFCYPDSRKMEIYYEGEFYTMAQALDQGIISDWNVEDFHYDHLERHMLDPLTDAMKTEIQAAWQKQFGSALTWQTDVSELCFYGSFSDLSVLFVEGAEPVESELTVGGFEFKHSSSFDIYVYTDGKFVDLATAYETGLVDVDILNFVAGVHYDYQKSLD